MYHGTRYVLLLLLLENERLELIVWATTRFVEHQQTKIRISKRHLHIFVININSVQM